MLKAALDELWNEGYKFSLNVYFTPTELSPYMNIHGRYSYDELEAIMDETDLLICPSVWYETFGYTVLEALSFGVPVLVTPNISLVIDLANAVMETDFRKTGRSYCYELVKKYL